jgi:hypothetical protein
MLCGAEALVVLRDVCHLGPDEASAVVRWAARTLVAATFDSNPLTEPPGIGPASAG